MLTLCPASQRGLHMTDCARTTGCCRRRCSTGLPDYGLFQDPVIRASGQSLRWPHAGGAGM
eukprot:9263318-Alexandrium_andersonii.AAC.1